ncbi:MAG: hypothetical protein AAF335_02740 [Bacteroidota bacterium]
MYTRKNKKKTLLSLVIFGSLAGSSKASNKRQNIPKGSLVFGVQKEGEILGNINETINTINYTILDLDKQLEEITEEVSKFINMLTFLVVITCGMIISYILYRLVFPSLHNMSRSFRKQRSREEIDQFPLSIEEQNKEEP